MSHFYRDLLLNARISINTKNKTIDVRCREQDLPEQRDFPENFVSTLITLIGRSFTIFDLGHSNRAYDRRRGQAYEIDFSWRNPANRAEGFLVTVKGDHVLTTDDLIHIVSKSYEILSINEGLYVWRLRIHEWGNFYQPIFPELQAKIRSDNVIQNLLLLSCCHERGKKIPLDVWAKIAGYLNIPIDSEALKNIVRREREIIRQSTQLSAKRSAEFGLFKANVNFCKKLYVSFLENNRHESARHQRAYDKEFGLIPYNYKL
ncbi:MAG TPA: hypothetical protein VGV92_07400 [Gammaproteobacteria bacterium]|nr:hypothetical protein [Gammaproteobacteria bacterium]